MTRSDEMTPSPITVLVPCKDQRHEFFVDALGSLVRQTSRHWVALVLADPSSPPELADWVEAFGDDRIQFVRCPTTGFAAALNHGLAIAGTEYVSILLSDDRYAPEAIETLHAYRSRFPQADFFHSARRHINAHGEPIGGVMPIRRNFRLEYFSTSGSPVKHLLCWRRETALSIGGMDEAVSVHGCDDYDFPWRMAEAGAVFEAVDECLYEYRLHHAHARLTTSVPVARQVDTLRVMFQRHGIDPRATDRHIERRIGGHLVAEYTDQIDHRRNAQLWVRCFYEAGADALPRFRAAGFEQRYFFPHRVYVLPKGGPDGLKLAQRMAGVSDPGQLREFVLCAMPPVADEIPGHVYFDDDVQWHQQQFGLPAQVACANVIVGDDHLRCYVLVSDLVQRISRLPAYRTRVDTRFQGWVRLLTNSILAYAAENGLETVYVATSDLALRNTDRNRHPKASLYERIYDHLALARGAVREGDWWRFSVKDEAGRIAPLTRSHETDQPGPIVCVIHDTEGGLGHRDSDPDFARQADEHSQAALASMLAVEATTGVRATYNLVGQLYGQYFDTIRSGGHAVAFHSWDHVIAKDDKATREQLQRCREVDYRVKGYRPPQSRITPGLTDATLAWFNFEWLASSTSSLKAVAPSLSNAIVKIPVHMDDYAMFRHGVSFQAWEDAFWQGAGAQEFVVVGLHDCYAPHWLPHYEGFLRRLQERATLLTLDEVAARVTLGHARWFEPGA